MVVPHFPADVSLPSPPLGEAWLEVRWQLKQSALPGQAEDPEYPYALGAFYAGVKESYPERRDLDSSRAPLDLLPHVVRHQFWSGPSRWPVLQFGPGVATVNFTKPYGWHNFRAAALHLRGKLVAAYESRLPACTLLVLRYANAEPFDYRGSDVLRFLSSKLNTTLSLPRYVPGDFAPTPSPSGLSIQASYELREPRGRANIMISTGSRPRPGGVATDPPRMAVIWQTEVIADQADAPDLSDDSAFSRWLDAAHAAAHEWFFALTEGELLARYQGGST